MMVKQFPNDGNPAIGKIDEIDNIRSFESILIK